MCKKTGFSERNANRKHLHHATYRKYNRLFLLFFISHQLVSNQYVNTLKDFFSPGIIALEGVRYVELHCPEIETHVLGNPFEF
jgi:hypothetical protein